MTVKRSSADKARDGHKAYEYRIAQYGPDEQKRAGQQADWTRRHPELDKRDNPYVRDKVYSEARRQRAEQFAAWQSANVNRSHADNPYAWSSADEA